MKNLQTNTHRAIPNASLQNDIMNPCALNIKVRIFIRDFEPFKANEKRK